MGVPAFFSWLKKKYPSVIVHCVEVNTQSVDGTEIPVDSRQPNPNGVEFDNLYLDMNRIIHNCTHLEDKPAHSTEDEMMIAIFEFIDRIFRIVRPRKVLYMSIDGVAPRAKMNLQRSRRFRKSRGSVEKITEIERIREEIIKRSDSLPHPKPKEDYFDSNCITPGTPFMDRLSKCLQYYIHERLNNDPGWAGIKVIFSDASVPGEGEHKIMDYIRRQRAMPGHDPNTTHCLCGDDADLIMLALATHEPKFVIIRETPESKKPSSCEIIGQVVQETNGCLGLEKQFPSKQNSVPSPAVSKSEFIFVRIDVLRWCLGMELQMPNLPFTYELERAVDDWVFICVFMRNDFLPPLPSLDMIEDALNRLVKLYKEIVYKTGGWLTNSGLLDLTRLKLFMSDLGKLEDEIILNRQKMEQRFKASRKREMQQELAASKAICISEGQFEPVAMASSSGPMQRVSCQFQGPTWQWQTPPHDSNDKANDNDELLMSIDGFKEGYYVSKFGERANNYEFRSDVGRQYVKGLCWVLRYYYQGCASWKWYFPHHYAPFASDLVNIGDLSIEFEKDTEPLRPLVQLMGVLPATSRSLVPEQWAELMIDPESKIADFYRDDFQIDLDGKKHTWQGIVLLPFVQEERLKETLKPFYDKLTDEERKRNVRGDARLYVRRGHAGYDIMAGLYQMNFSSSRRRKRKKVRIDVNKFQGVLFQGLFQFQGFHGHLLVSEDNVPFQGTLKPPINGLLEIVENQVVCCRYRAGPKLWRE